MLRGMETLSLDEAGNGFLHEVSCPRSERKGAFSPFLREKREKEGTDYDTARTNLGSGNMVM